MYEWVHVGSLKVEICVIFALQYQIFSDVLFIIFISVVVGKERIVLQPYTLEDPPVKELIKVHTISRIIHTSLFIFQELCGLV